METLRPLHLCSKVPAEPPRERGEAIARRSPQSVDPDGMWQRPFVLEHLAEIAAQIAGEGRGRPPRGGATGSGSPAIAASLLSKVIDHVGAMAKSLMAETGAAESDVAAMPAGVGAPPEERQFELSGSSMCM
jgi:hypothetical protein